MFIVTGGGTGIGRAIALALQGAGGQVLIAGRRPGPLADVVQASGGAITAVACDTSAPEGARAVAAGVTGDVEGLVHCAGGNPAIGRPDPDSLEAEAALLGRQSPATSPPPP